MNDRTEIVLLAAVHMRFLDVNVPFNSLLIIELAKSLSIDLNIGLLKGIAFIYIMGFMD